MRQFSMQNMVKSMDAKNKLDPFRRFDRTPTCDRQTDRQTDRVISNTALALRRAGNNN